MSNDIYHSLKDLRPALRQPIPMKHIEPFGVLPNTPEACALWQFLICAFQALEKVEAQTTLEGAEDQVADLMQIANSIRQLYQLESLESMFQSRLIAKARQEAFRSVLPWNPRVDAFFATGGRSYRIMDRDPDKVGQ